jgi:anaerobic ribonucleoside-triphosphate reductase activating protein
MTVALPHVPATGDAAIRVGRVVTRCKVLGPGVRSVVWTQCCDLGCPNCILPESHAREGGTLVSVEALAAALLEDDVPSGLTLSGGEPFMQPAACARLVELMRARRPDLSVMVFSGYRMATLRRRSDPGTRALLAVADLLIDGAYVEGRHADLRWRGSSNQRIHILTPRHADLRHAPDVGQGIEVGMDEDGELFLNGVPSVPGARNDIERLLGLDDDGHGPDDDDQIENER